MKDIGSYFLFLCALVTITSAEEINMESTFVWRSTPCDANQCDQRVCTTDEECHRLDVTMKCISGWCTCRDNAPYLYKCLSDKRIGDDCLLTEECSKSGGFCNDGVCECYSNTMEFRGECYKGYKANLDQNLTLYINDLKSLAFGVSDKDQEYQIILNDAEARYTYDFNELDVWSTDSQNQVSIKRLDSTDQECGLCEILFNPTTAVAEIIFGGSLFTMGVNSYDAGTDDFNVLCEQINGILFVTPSHIVIERTGDGATTNIDFHPFNHDVLPETGFLGDTCSTPDDCKPLGSTCNGGTCECDGDHSPIPRDYCAPKVNGLGSGCSVTDQCLVPNSVCSGNSICECKSGFTEQAGSCV